MAGATIIEGGGGRSYLKFRKGFDPFGIFGWDIPKRLINTAPFKNDPTWPTEVEILYSLAQFATCSRIVLVYIDIGPPY